MKSRKVDSGPAASSIVKKPVSRQEAGLLRLVMQGGPFSMFGPPICGSGSIY